MAKLHANFSVDMRDLASAIGEVSQSDDHTLVVSHGQDETYYLGDFSYPDGAWKGTIEKVFVSFRGVEWWGVTGIELDTRFATAGADQEAAYRRAFSGNDGILGSGQVDRLIGYAGNDRLNGRGGDDLLSGGRGNDRLLGSAGSDILGGQGGRDVLKGDQGDDRLTGGKGADIFVFGGSDGADRITDFRNGTDRIEIEDGAGRFDQLEIVRKGDDVSVAFDGTVILIADVALRAIGAEDFIF